MRNIKFSLAFTLLFASTNLLAALAENLTVTPMALSMGNAVTADPPGVFAAHYNPAGFARVPMGSKRQTLSLLAPKFETGAKFRAPKDYQIFNYSDDPIVCAKGDSAGKCVEFKEGSSFTDELVIYVPGKRELQSPPPFAMPTGGIVYRPPNSKYTFATAGYAPLAAGYRRDPDDPGRFNGTEMALERITFLSPTIAVQVSDTFSFGASVGISYSAFLVNQDMRSPNELIGVIRFFKDAVCPTLKEIGGGMPFIPPDCVGEGLNPFSPLASVKLETTDTLGLSYNLGMLWEPNNDFAIGLVYQAPAEMNLRGEFTFTNSEQLSSTFAALQGDPFIAAIVQLLGLPTNVPKTEKGDVRVDLTLPEHVALGTKIALTDNLQLNVDWRWTDWEKWAELDIILNRVTSLTKLSKFTGASTLTKLTLPQGFVNQANFGLGLKYHLNRRWELRAGWEPRKSSVPKDRISLLVPFADADLFGAGVSYTLNDNFTFDFSMAYLKSETHVPANSSRNLNATGIDNIIYNPYAGLDVDIKTEVYLAAITFEMVF